MACRANRRPALAPHFDISTPREHTATLCVDGVVKRQNALNVKTPSDARRIRQPRSAWRVAPAVYVVTLAALAGGGPVGCSKSSPNDQTQSAPEVLEHVKPQSNRPIIVSKTGDMLTLTFRGDDAPQTVAQHSYDGVLGYGLSTSGRVAAVLHTNGQLVFLDSLGQSRKPVTLLGYQPPTDDWRDAARVHISDEGSALIAVSRREFPLVARSRPAGTLAKPREQQFYWYVGSSGDVHRLEFEHVADVCLLSNDRIVVVSSAGDTQPGRGVKRWFVTWYGMPSQPSWRATFRDRPWLERAEIGGHVDVRLPGHWNMRLDEHCTPRMIQPNAEMVRQWNPNYVKRAGDFYREQYLPATMDSLISAADLTSSQADAARTLLDQFIDDWLSADVQDAMLILPEHHTACVDKLDRAMHTMLGDSKQQREAYDDWRQRGGHALSFLLNRHNIDPRKVPRFTVTRFE